jgi:hypothetical protein
MSATPNSSIPNGMSSQYCDSPDAGLDDSKRHKKRTQKQETPVSQNAKKINTAISTENSPSSAVPPSTETIESLN